jgi:hypothetical protein
VARLAAEREAQVEPNGVPDDLSRGLMARVGDRLHAPALPRAVPNRPSSCDKVRQRMAEIVRRRSCGGVLPLGPAGLDQRLQNGPLRVAQHYAFLLRMDKTPAQTRSSSDEALSGIRSP